MRQPMLSDLMRRVNRALAAAYHRQEPKLTLPQVDLLRALKQKGPMTQTALVEATGIDRSTLAAMMQSHGAQNLITRVRVESDKRAKLVSITPAGLAALIGNEIALAAAEAEIMRMVPRGDRATFRNALKAVTEAAAAERL